MPVAHLRYVGAAADVKCFRRAAKSLWVKQSRVGRVTQQLEDDLGISLFRRQSMGPCLTDVGRRLLCAATLAVEQIELEKGSGRAAIGGDRVEVAPRSRGDSCAKWFAATPGDMRKLGSAFGMAALMSTSPRSAGGSLFSHLWFRRRIHRDESPRVRQFH